MRTVKELWLFAAVAICCAFVGTSGHKCPDGESECSDTSTCCPIGDEEYGCCQLVSAVCCSDRLHCCPSGTVCDTEHQRCLKEGMAVVTRHKVLAKRPPKVDGDIICPDRRSKCPSGTTCCDLGHGRFGCCPLPEAVCCRDHLHCCPKNTQCLIHEGQCIRDETNEVIPWYRKFRSTKLVRKPALKNTQAATLCSSGAKCPNGGTCCVDLYSERPRCCASGGVCCRGGRHCCPRGYECVSDEERCVKENEDVMVMVPWLDTAPSVSDDEVSVSTCDDTSECLEGSQCCASTDDHGSTVFTCCPLTEGVCCGRTCCPRGYMCAESDKCEKKALAEMFAELID